MKQMRLDLCLLLITFCLAGVQCEVENVPQLIAALQLKLTSRCVFLLGNSQKIAEAVLLQKQLDITSTILNFSNFAGASCMGLSLYVLLETSLFNKETHAVLQNIANKSVWVLFLKDEDVEELFQSMDMPYNSMVLFVNHTEVIEVYRIQPNESLNTRHVAIWRNGSLEWSERGMAQRRRDMGGVTLNVAVREMPPFLFIKETDDGGAYATGLIGELWNILQQTMNFRTNIVVLPANSSVDEMIGLVASGGRQLALGHINMTPMRYNSTDFTVSIVETSAYIYVSRGETHKLRWSGFLKPFSTKLWLAVGGTLLLIALHLYAVRRYNLLTGPEPRGLLEAVLYAASIFCLQDCSSAFASHSSRAVLLVAYLTATTVLSSYSAALISHLTVRERGLPFRDVEDFIKHSSYKLMLISGSAELEFILKSADPIVQELASNHPVQDFVRSSAGIHLRRLCSEPLAVFGYFDFELKTHNFAECDIVKIPGLEYTRSNSLAIAKRSPYLPFINFNLRRIREGGLLQRMKRESSMESFQLAVGKPASVELMEVAPVLVALGVACCLSFVILALEVVRAKYRKKIERETVFSETKKRCSYSSITNRMKILD